jgi:hypothetical protein
MECEIYNITPGGMNMTTWKAFRLLETKEFKMREPIWPLTLNGAMLVEDAGTGSL